MATGSRPAKGTARSVARRIEDLILEGSLRPNDQLLPERELAERLSVSRPTVRDGLSILEQKGLLVSQPGAETVVAKIGVSISDPLTTLLSTKLETAFDYLKFREVNESAAAAWAAEKGTVVDLQNISAKMARIEKEHAQQDPADEADADVEFHLAIYEATHNLVLLHVMRALTGMLHSGVFYSRTKLYERAEVRGLLRDQHKSIHDAILRRDPVAASKAAAEHIGYVDTSLREIVESEKRLSVSLRRLGDGGGRLSEDRARKKRAG
jgi:GntR family transcriptional repressor for pyruvate dehydrogenase complex